MWLNKWVHKLFLQCWSRSFFNLKPMSVIVYQFQTVKFIQMMSLTFGLFTQVSGSGPLGPLVFIIFLIEIPVSKQCRPGSDARLCGI